MTFSIVARCPDTGQFGMAISSSSPAVAARCVFTRAGVGAVASQNITNPALGSLVLELLELGLSATAAVEAVQASQVYMQYRQLLVVDNQGTSAVHSGKNALGIFTSAAANDVAAGGNLLANDTIPQAMLEGFVDSSGSLTDRLLISLKAGLEAGGEAGPVHSAGLQVSDGVPWPVVDLRCDWTDACPIAEIEAAWRIYKPQLDDYITRALNPSEAPSYGVPGDEQASV